MKVGTKPYFNNVLKELINIKKYATKEELDNLNFNTLNTNNEHHCIYGQMAESCHSYRGKALIRLCCKTKTSFESIYGNYTIDFPPRFNDRFYISYLENCIVKFSHNNNNIIKFLKSEIDTITLTSK